MFFRNIKNNNRLKGGSWIPYTIATCAAVAFYTVLNNIPAIGAAIGSFASLMMPVIIGVTIAYMLTPFVKMIDRHLVFIIKNEKARNLTAITIAGVVILVLISILVSLLVPQLVDSIVQFANNIYIYSETLTNLIDSIAENAHSYNLDMARITDMFNETIEKMVRFFTDNAKTILNSSFSIGGNAVNFIIGIILAIYFLAGKRAIFAGFDRLMINTMKPGRYSSAKRFLSKCNEIFTKFIIDDIIDACIVGIVNFFFMSVAGMPYSVLISVVVGVTNLAPTFGPFVGAFIGGFILLFADTRNAVLFLIFTLVLQIVDGYIIKPKLFGNSLGVPGVWITVGIVVGGKLFGVPGILLAVPVVGIVTFIYRGYIERCERIRLSDEDKSEADAAEEAENEAYAEGDTYQE
ncbi:MAG: AI-2E family transporter [Clostridiales bacterium]|nr:AI-2E family transporter [Clostridiales bacterium]